MLTRASTQAFPHDVVGALQDLNRARHLMKKSAKTLAKGEKEVFDALQTGEITLFGIDSFPL